MSIANAEKIGNIIVSIVTVVAIISGGLFSFIEYSDHKKSERIKQSLDLVKRYNTGVMLKHRLESNKAWQNTNKELIELFNIDNSPAAYEGFVVTKIKKLQLEEPINSLLGLYEESVICVESGLCDIDTIESYFSKNGRTFFNKYYPYVCSQRKKWNDPTIWANVQKYYNLQSVGKICN